MSPRTAMQLLNGGRVVIGAALTVLPVTAGEGWIGAAARTGGGQVALRALGVRDLVLGLGAVHAARSRDARSAATWSLALAACDTVDFVATGAARAELPNRGVPVMAIAFGAAAAGVALATRL